MDLMVIEKKFKQAYIENDGIGMVTEMETIELFSINKVAWLKAHNVHEADRKIYCRKDKKDRDKYIVSFMFCADQAVEDLLVEYKYDSQLQEFLRTFKEVNSEIFCETMYYIQNKNNEKGDGEYAKEG